jgi:hypothetical protein
VVVIGGGMISDYAEVKQVRKLRACEMLDACRDRLADFYSRAGRMENEGWEMRLAANCTLSEWLRDYDEVRVWRGDVKAAWPRSNTCALWSSQRMRRWRLVTWQMHRLFCAQRCSRADHMACPLPEGSFRAVKSLSANYDVEDLPAEMTRIQADADATDARQQANDAVAAKNTAAEKSI